MIRYLINTALTFLWALWLGGLIALVMIITTMAGVVSDHTVFGSVASAIFRRFEEYELTLAGMLLVLMLLWTWSAPSRRKVVVFMLFLTAATASAYTRFLLVPRIDTLRLQGLTTTPEFHHLHTTSTTMYTYEVGLLLVAGLLLPCLRARTQLRGSGRSSSPQRRRRDDAPDPQ